MVVVHRLRLALLDKCIVGRWRLIPLLQQALILGVGIIEEVRAVELHSLLLTPRIGVLHADRAYARHATLWAHHIPTYAATAVTHTATARHAEDILEREVLLVDVVKEADHRYAARAVEEVYVTSNVVLMVRRNIRHLRLVYIATLELQLRWRAIDIGLVAVAPI